MSSHRRASRSPASQWCPDCHEYGFHAVGCPSDDTDEDFPVERDTETLDAFDFMNENAGHTTETR